MTMPQYYIRLLEEYTALIASLHTKVESVVSIKAVGEYKGRTSFKKARIISEQIKKWPKNNFVLPPSAWVEPRR